MVWGSICTCMCCFVDFINKLSDLCARFWFCVLELVWFVLHRAWEGLQTFHHDFTWFLSITGQRFVFLYYLFCECSLCVTTFVGNVFIFVNDLFLSCISLAARFVYEVQEAAHAVQSFISSLVSISQQLLTKIGHFWHHLLFGIPLGICNLLILAVSFMRYMLGCFWIILLLCYHFLGEFFSGIPQDALIGLAGMLIVVAAFFRWYSVMLLRRHTVLGLKYLVHFVYLCLARTLLITKHICIKIWVSMKLHLPQVFHIPSSCLHVLLRWLNVARRNLINASPFHVCNCEMVRRPFTCVVCFDEERRVVVKPCNHLLVCSECGRRLEQDRAVCPMCRTRVEEYVHTYMS
ncbi:hypothetical protein PR048_012558 [Dryococelus australis]|uniref:RING-type domain-containing protein n=1 Tax=Dryococelus australis TaxID=614101 RepID=A0ABQ9HPT7_9NEOP|nr:hypothetical protein PR048_012558 [Dryococelus australis]